MTHYAPSTASVNTPAPYYQDDLVTLYHGDCREQTAWLQADVLVTDPPYGMAHDLTRSTIDVPIAGDRDTTTRDAALGAWGAKRPALVFGHWRKPRPLKVRMVLIWDKSHMALGDPTAPFATTHEEIYLMGEGAWVPGRRPTVLRFPGLLGDVRPNHPTPKPIPLMEALIAATPPGVIADPFAGSGATLLAAKYAGRRAVGVEFEERYCEIIANRLAQDTLFGGAA